MGKRFTILTPTYNRADLLVRLFGSLTRQTFRDFEWIVVDDGSTDSTEETVLHFQQAADFEIKYIYQPNGGKHRAINAGMRITDGELVFIADSDDYLAPDSLDACNEVERSIPEDSKQMFAGICGLDGYDINRIVGTTYTSQEFLDITQFERVKYGISGDKKEVFYAKILREYPFPEIKDEKFITESIVWNRIAASGLKLRYFNRIIYIVEYQNEGISANQGKHLIGSPKGWAIAINEDIVNRNMCFWQKWQYRYGYYGSLRNSTPAISIAEYLGLNPVTFLFMMRIIQLKNKLGNLLK